MPTISASRPPRGLLAVTGAVALAGCGGGVHTVSGPPRHGTATSSSVTVKARLTAIQTHVVKQGCRNFAYDLSTLVAELKQSDLTHAELSEAAEYVTGDLTAFRPALAAPQQFTTDQAQKVLATAETSAGPQSVAPQATDSLDTELTSPLFSRVTQTVRALCASISR